MDDPSGLPEGHALIVLDVVDGTNAEALRLIAAGAAAPGLVIRAERQTAGRGRQGRTWQSPVGNLYASLVVALPAARPPAELSLVAGVALAEAVRGLLPGRAHAVTLKWPNDLLIGGRKVAGVLIETADAGGGTRAVVGIGLNVATHPDDGQVHATSLAAEGLAVALDAVLAAVVTAFDRWFARWAERGIGPVRANWLAAAEGLGREIAARSPGGELRGVFVGLDQDGALLLRGEGGKRYRVSVADVVFGPG